MTGRLIGSAAPVLSDFLGGLELDFIWPIPKAMALSGIAQSNTSAKSIPRQTFVTESMSGRHGKTGMTTETALPYPFRKEGRRWPLAKDIM